MIMMECRALIPTQCAKDCGPHHNRANKYGREGLRRILHSSIRILTFVTYFFLNLYM